MILSMVDFEPLVAQVTQVDKFSQLILEKKKRARKLTN